MGLAPRRHFADLRAILKEAAREITERDPRVHAVGISARRGRAVFRAVRSMGRLEARATRPLLDFVDRVRVVYDEVPHELVPLYRIPGVTAQAPSLPEQERQRPLVMGLQIQNFDCDERSGAIGQGFLTVGTLGCFVTSGGRPMLLSNNHVIAGENRARPGDRILQPGSLYYGDELQVAQLAAFEPLRFSDGGGLGMTGGEVNLIDAAVAALDEAVPYRMAYLERHRLEPPRLVRDPVLGEHVYKVGRTTGLTRGRVTTVEVDTGPVGYESGSAYFERSFAVRGLMGTQFSSGGDSGSAVVASSDGALLGLLYAGDGVETYNCLASEVFRALELDLPAEIQVDNSSRPLTQVL